MDPELIEQRMVERLMEALQKDEMLLDAFDPTIFNVFYYIGSFLISCLFIGYILYRGIKWYMNWRGIEDSMTDSVKLWLVGAVSVVCFACAYVGSEVDIDRQVEVGRTNCMLVNEDVAALKYNKSSVESMPKKAGNLFMDLRKAYRVKCRESLGIVR